MAKYPRVEYGKEVVEDSFRIHGGYGFSKDTRSSACTGKPPMLLIGEGTAEIQKMIGGRRLLEEYRSLASARHLGAADGRVVSAAGGGGPMFMYQL